MRLLPVLLAIAGASVAVAQTNTFRIDPGRSPSTFEQAAETQARAFGQQIARLTERARAVRRAPAEFSMPVRIERLGAPTRSSRAPGPITLQFDSAGSRAFPTAYRDLLQSVFDASRPTLDALFGTPMESGSVFVRNFDADISDRDAVVGGYYVPDNGAGQREIRFPIYLSNEAAVVNFIHCLLLAYQGNLPYAFDAYQEGLVRAVTMRVARQNSALPAGLDSAKIDEVLDGTYDVGTWYDWNNQPALSASRFIPANLRDTPLPAGGSVGGLYLLRYQMAGSAFQKVLAEYPTFAAELNARIAANPAKGGSLSSLATEGQSVLNFLRPADPTIEGLSYGVWVARQFALASIDTFGLKLMLEPVPIASGLAGGDFGVFNIQAHFFSTAVNGNENLLTGTAYPIFWDKDGNRTFPDAQSDRMDIAGAYGSVAPNFPDQNAGVPYRITAEVPVQDQIARAYLPAGAIATAGRPTPNDFYGSVSGVRPAAGSTLRVRLQIGAEVVDPIPVTDFAFGIRVGTVNFLGPRSCVVQLIQTTGGVDTVLIERRVNKGPGPLAVDLNVGGVGSQTINLPAGISAAGFGVQPFAQRFTDVLGLAQSPLVARFNASRARYDLAPEVLPFRQGLGYFVRVPAAVSAPVSGTMSPLEPVGVALRPGWNMVSSPFPSAVSVSSLQVVRASSFPRTFDEAAGQDVGLDVFGFVPGTADPVSGVPETGTFVKVTSFAPGQAYFVRCLAPEGVTLVFREAVGRAATEGFSGWAREVAVRDGAQVALAHLGMAVGATETFDPRYDSGLPPSIGGLQIASIGTEPQFRDVRPYASYRVYELRLTGLRPGRRTALEIGGRGRESGLTVFEANGRAHPIRPGWPWTFVPNSPTMTVRLVVRGAR